MSAGYYISKGRCVFVVCLWVAITVSIGLMAGLINKSCPNGNGDPGQLPVTSTTPRDQPPSTTLPPQGHGPWMNPFLPDDVIPVAYDLWFHPDFYFNGETFKGRENIEIYFKEKSKYIIVHTKLLTITETKAFDDIGNPIDVVQTFEYKPNQFWVTEVKDEISAGATVHLHLEFEGSLGNAIVGYYKSTYINKDTGIKSWLATTKFQPTDARRAFPNFDEPKFKANFTVTLRHWKNFTALSNMPSSSFDNLDDVWRETHFETTPKMSSYLVCFIVCDFVYRETTLKNGKPSRVWTSSDKIEQVEYALRITTNITDYFEQEFNMEYQLPKLDQVAVPDYPSGATEHWGLITYREARLLYDDREASAANKQGVAEIVAHELSHNYFGNLVTCRWWDDIWLNEGFASYYGDMSLVDIEPEFQMEDHFIITTTQSIMEHDAEVMSRPIMAAVTSPDEVNQAFTGVVYSKAAAVLRMMESFIGKNNMREAIRRYLRQHQYGSVITTDFYEAVQQQVGSSYNITSILNSWLAQMGFPVITIRQDGENIVAEQKRFLYDLDAELDFPKSPYGYKWYVPLTFKTPHSNVTTVWLNMTSATFKDPRTNKNEWLKFNYKQNGFYRVNYPREMWGEISRQLEHNYQVFDPVDRANILDDAFNLARASQLDFTVALNLTSYMFQETHYFPWTSSALSLSYISLMLSNDGQYTLWRKYINKIISPAMKQLQVRDGGDHLDKLNRRNNIIPLACDHGHKECLENTTALFKQWINNDTFYLPPNLRRFVYKYGMQSEGGEDVWYKVWSRFTRASGPEKYNLAYCLSWTNKLWLIHRYLDYAMDPSVIKSQDFFTVIRYISANPIANGYSWDWTRANYKTLINRFGVRDRYFGRMVPEMVAGYNTKFQLQEVESFYNEFPEAGAGYGPRLASLSSIKSNIAWMKENRLSIIDWLVSYHSNT